MPGSVPAATRRHFRAWILRWQAVRAPSEFSQFGARVGVSAFELDLWGRVRSLSAAALRHYFATVEGQRAFPP